MTARVWLALLVLVAAALVVFWNVRRDKSKLASVLEVTSRRLAADLRGDSRLQNGAWWTRGSLAGCSVTIRLAEHLQIRDDTDEGPAFVPEALISTPCKTTALSLDLRYRGGDWRNTARDTFRRLGPGDVSTFDDRFDRAFSLAGAPPERLREIFDSDTRRALLALEPGFQSHAWRLRLEDHALCLEERFSRHDRGLSSSELRREISRRLSLLCRIARKLAPSGAARNAPATPPNP